MRDFNSRDRYLGLADMCRQVENWINGRFGDIRYWVVAEISGLSEKRGHCYLNLIEKDAESTNPKAEIRAIIWSSRYININENFIKSTGSGLKENMKILLAGTINYDIKYGLSFIIDDVEPQYTLGMLLKEKQEIIERLKKEGLYDMNKKRTFPLVPQRVAVISAENSKGYEDFRKKLEDNKYGYKFKLNLFVSLLQGDYAAGEMVSKLIEIYNQINNFDIVVIVRGGGGNVSLNSFNDYKLSKAVARFPIPVITGIGHTANVSIVDEVAYCNRITPTDVADFIVNSVKEYETIIHNLLTGILGKYKQIQINENHRIKLYSNNLFHYLRLFTEKQKSLLENSYLKIVNRSSILIREEENRSRYSIKNLHHIITVLGERSRTQNLEKYMRLKVYGKRIIDNKYAYITALKDKVNLLDPVNVLKRGYSITLLNGKPLKNTETVKQGDILETILADGALESSIINVKK